MSSWNLYRGSASQVPEREKDSGLLSEQNSRATSDKRNAVRRKRPYRSKRLGVASPRSVREDSSVSDDRIQTEVSSLESVPLKKPTRQRLSRKTDLVTRTTKDKVPKPIKEKRVPSDSMTKTDQQRTGQSRTVINDCTDSRVPATVKQAKLRISKKKRNELLNLKHQVNALKNHFGVLKQLFSQLSLDLNQVGKIRPPPV